MEYQPAVVLVGGGAEAIRGVSSTGITWNIDASAPHAGDVVEGKIMFLTNRAVGRVLAVRKDGNTLAVTVGPVLITDVIRKAHIDINMPIDLGEAIAYTAPELPGQAVPSAPMADARPTDGAVLTTVVYSGQTPPAAAPPAAVPPVPECETGEFQAHPAGQHLGHRASRNIRRRRAEGRRPDAVAPEPALG